MNITIQQSNQVTERNVPASIIHCIYNLGEDPNIDLSGAIQLTGGAYVDEIEAVQSWYQNLYITADKQYIRFADPQVKQIVINWASSDGVGVTLSDAQTHRSLPVSKFRNAPITTFDEFIYFTGLSSISNSAFRECASLTSIGIPSSITSVEPSAFYGCSKLKKVHMRSVEDFCKIQFSSNDYSTPFRYGADLYVDGTKITDLVIPYSITNIQPYAFRYCTWMQSVTVHENFDGFSSNAFEQCTELTKVYTPDLSTWLRIKFSNSYANPLYYAKHLYVGDTEVTDLIIPNDITIIKSYAFYNCAEITSVTIPNTVENIASGAFNGCNGITAVYISDLEKYCNYNSGFPTDHHIYLNGDEIINLTIPNGVTSIASSFEYSTYINSVTIPNTVKTIGISAFSHCTSLNSVTIPPSVTSINNAAFSNCTQLNSIYISDLSAWFKMDINSNISLPDDIHVYLNGTEITNLTIPSDITNILRFACEGWNYITQLTIPSSVTIIGTYAFSKCAGLTSVTIPSSVVQMGAYAFSNCAELDSVTIEGNLTNAYAAFNSCKNLTSATFLNGTTIVDAFMFLSCDNLVNVTLSNSITTIKQSAFNGCKKLTSITLPSSITNIGNSAFDGCSLLTEVISEATVPPTADSTIFRYCPNSLIIYVPAESVDAYKAASGWSSYASKIQAIPSNP